MLESVTVFVLRRNGDVDRMNFLRKNWYYLGGVLFVALAFCVGFWGNHIGPLRKILLLSFMALLVHQFEEYAVPGGFPAVFNIGWQREKEAPDRYPLNRMSCLCVNVFAAYPFYLLPVFSPTLSGWDLRKSCLVWLDS